MAEPEAATTADESIAARPSVSRLPQGAWWLRASTFVSWWLYVALVWLSRRIAFGTPVRDRPLIPALCVLAALFGLYIFQVHCAIRRKTANETMMPFIVGFAIAVRLLLLFSEPIQEVDAYRYLWDGKVVASGVNPFRYSPSRILNASADDALADPRVAKLVDLRDQSEANSEILRRVHFRQLTTVYPPVSQAVFTLAASVTPHKARVNTHLLIIKVFIIAFDLATFWMLIGLLRLVGRPAEWSIVYAWCPLVMKEFANSGHLDSIAVFLTVATVYCAVRSYDSLTHNWSDIKTDGVRHARMSARNWTLLSAISLALAIGAKIYPVVLAPLLFLSAWKKVGRTVAVSAGFVVLALASLMVVPMLFRDGSDHQPNADTVENALPIPNTLLTSSKRSARRGVSNVTSAGGTGLVAFAGRWQMNDFLFLLVFENLKPPGKPVAADNSIAASQPGGTAAFSPHAERSETSTVAEKRSRRGPWFVITTSQWRRTLVATVTKYTSARPGQVPFFAARLLTSGLFLLLAIRFAFQAANSDSTVTWLRSAFLTIAWFWMLSPTQNPWYWTWALPFVPFAGSRAWLAMSGLVLLYYVRFWFGYHASSTYVMGTPYMGVEFFDYVVTWVEYCPWLIWLLWTSRGQRTSAVAEAV